MRARGWILGLVLFFASAVSASAQNSQISPLNTTGTSAPSFFTTPLAKPNFSGFSAKPVVPSSLNLLNMMPSFSFLQNSILARGAPATPITVTSMQQRPPVPTQPGAPGTSRFSRFGFGGGAPAQNANGYGNSFGSRPTYSGFFP